jgi:glycolate oxidase FAD binding subunit
MTWLETGNPVRRIGLVLSLQRMRRIVDYSPPDLTATVESGLKLTEFNEMTLAERQWLPLDPPGLPSSSLGAIASCNSSGPLRLGFGVPRDYVIGINLVHADGTTSKSGGRVAKNVAGYDMNKLYVGSYGTLAIMTQITFKLRPLPDCSSTLLITSSNQSNLFQLGSNVFNSELQPASVAFTRRLPESVNLCARDDALLIRFIDNEAAVQAQVKRVTGSTEKQHELNVLSQMESDTLWRAVADLEHRETRIKISVPISALRTQFEKMITMLSDCIAVADIGTGIIRLAFDADDDSVVDLVNRLRANAAAINGSVVIEKASLEVRRAIDSWGEVGSTAPLMKSIKAAFDPQSLLNPGKFILGL